MTQGTLFRILLCVATQQVMGNKPSVKTGERFIFYGPDANGRSTDLQSDRLGSIPTVSTLIRWSVHLGVRIQGFHPCHTGSNPVPTTPCQGRQVSQVMRNVKMVSHPENATVHKLLDARSHKGCIVAGSSPVLTSMSKRYSQSSNQDFKNDSAECLRREWDIFGTKDDENLLHRNLDFFHRGCPTGFLKGKNRYDYSS